MTTERIYKMDYSVLADLLFPNVTETVDDIEKRYPPRDLPEGARVMRIAPSPTGYLHIGALYQAMANERSAHLSGGKFYFRIEDTDSKREVQGAAELFITMFGKYGIKFDEGAVIDGDNGDYGPYRQSQRTEIYQTFAKKLVQDGRAYPCFCTDEELDAIRKQQEEDGANPGYYGKYAKWRDASIEDIETALKEGKPYVIRLRSIGDASKRVKVKDAIKGELEFPQNDQDFVILKSNGTPPYHFAHAVDDHLMHTTHVMRGEEWVATLPWHVELFDALGFKRPVYCHTATLMKLDGESKRKISKRKDPEADLAFYIKEGYPKDGLLEYVMTLLNSNFEDWRRANPLASMNDFQFSFKKMSVSGALFDIQKLYDVSKNVIAKMDADTVTQLVSEWAGEFDPDFAAKIDADRDYARQIFAIGRGGAKPRKDFGLWKEAKGYMGFFYDEYFAVEDEIDEKFDRADVSAILRDFAEAYSPELDSDAWFAEVKRIAEAHGFCPDMKEYKKNPDAYKGSVGDVSMFLRIAIAGKRTSPDLCAVMGILGEERSRARLLSFADSL